MKKGKKIALLVVPLGVLVILTLRISGVNIFSLINLFKRQPSDKIGISVWENKGPTPLGEKGFMPQGLAWMNNSLIFANSWKNTRSRIYHIDPTTMEIQSHFDMPPEATHVSGLAWDGKYLWAVDHISNQAYKIDLKPSLSDKSVHLAGKFSTTLNGTSASCFVTINGENFLAISDFMITKRTIFVRHNKAIEDSTAEGNIFFSYRNEGFSQGLEFDGQYLYESENKYGTDIINKMDLDLLLKTADARKATIIQYPGPKSKPSKLAGVEDLAWDGKYFWTSDETTFCFYKGLLK